MIIGRIGAQVALLAFSLSLLAGLWVGNPPVTVLSRALLMLVAALLVGHLVAWCGHLVLLEDLTQRKAEIDTRHAQQRRRSRPSQSPTSDAAPGTQVEG